MNRLPQPGELFLAQEAAGDVGPRVEVRLGAPSLVIPDVRVLARAPEPGIEDKQAEVAVGHLPASPFLGIPGSGGRLVSRHQVVDDLEVAPHVVPVLAEITVGPDRDLFRTLDVVHAVVVVPGIDGVPVAHHLPAGRWAAERGGDDLVRVVGGGRVQEELHVPDVVFPHHDLEFVVVQVPVGAGRGLVVDEKASTRSRIGQIRLAPADGMAGEAA